MTCTFFGHRECPPAVLPKLKATLENLINYHDVYRFLVGSQGEFDLYAYRTLRELKEQYPQITYRIVLAYPPDKRAKMDFIDYSDTILPDGIEKVPRRFAISFRNKWMIEQSAYAVIYITHPFGGAAQFAQLAEKRKKICINLALDVLPP